MQGDGKFRFGQKVGGGSGFTVARFWGPAITTTADNSSGRTYCLGYGSKPMGRGRLRVCNTDYSLEIRLDVLGLNCSSSVFPVWRVWRNYRTMQAGKLRFPEIASMHTM
jgi:hypothetical protein